MPKKKTILDIAIVRTNPGIKLEISDATILKLFTDVAAMKVQMKILIAVMFIGFSTIAGLIVGGIGG